MKLRRLLCLFLALLMLTLAACDAAEPPSGSGTGEKAEGDGTTEDPENQPEEEYLPMDKKYRILFIGNSYTYYNDMPTEIFELFAEAAGYTVEVKSITKGSHTLEKFADPNDAYGAQVEDALLHDAPYDFVILQEQSVRPASNEANRFYAAVRNLTGRIRETGAEPILYATWGRKTGSATLDSYGWTNEVMAWRLAASYQAIGDELNVTVAHVGLAFLDVYTNQSTIELYNSDLSHPSHTGSYLAAVTLFATVFRMDPTTVDYEGTLSAAQATVLYKAAQAAVFATPAIPEEYKTSSEGR